MRKKRVGAVLLVAVVMAVIRTFIVMFNMEKNNYENDTYYLLDNIQSSAFSVAVVVCLALFLALAFAYGKGKRAVLDTKNDTVSAASCMLAFILFGTVIIYIVSYFMNREVHFGMTVVVRDKLVLAVVALSVCSAVAFLLSGLRVCSNKSLALFALLPLLLTVFRVLCDFIRTNSAPLASSGAYHITGLAVLLLYFLCEGKAYLSRGSAALYYAFGYCAVLLLLVYSVPNLILHCFGVFSFDYYAALSVVDIVTVAYICARLSSASIVQLKEESI